MLASIIITTYNRREALVETINVLGKQTVPPDQYEIVVVDDGSTDDTYEVVSKMSLDCSLKVFRHPENRGISAGRNLAIRNAIGRNLILVSDDLLVPENFIAMHLDTLGRYPGWWVVGGFKQLDSLTTTPFGRYLDQLEKGFERMRTGEPIGDGLFEMTWPTARNLSLPRADLDRTGLFDEQFRSSCEDQDLAHRARDFGIRFLYNASITSLHNDQAGDRKRCCKQQQRFAEQTVSFCEKYPAIHGDSELARKNGFITKGDSLMLIASKAAKWTLSRGPLRSSVEGLISFGEWLRVPDRFLFRMYRRLIALYIFRGWRDGLRSSPARIISNVHSLGYHTDL
ncbi:MAG TPA: glycosyltransferase family 2 protein [Blastocatellia bacterium]|nr:glycosyltransferase family 2 protein [Blastocatellia bacterium]